MSLNPSIAEFKVANLIISGPVYDKMTVQEAAQPVPEDGILIATGIGLGILVVYLFRRLT